MPIFASRSLFTLCPFVAILFLLSSCRHGGSNGAFTREQFRSGATALHSQQLFQESIDLYRAYLASPVVSTEDVPKVLYQIGVIYQDDLKLPRAALAQYTLVKSLFPDQAFAADIGKRMVACLEAEGRSADASQAMSSLTQLPGDSNASAVGDGTVLAEVEGRKITAGELALALGGKLPESPVEQTQAMHQYVGQILLAQSARRRGLAEKADIKRGLDQMETQILAQAALREDLKIAPPKPEDLKYYYEANKARYQHGADSGASMEKLMPRVRDDWAREKQGGAYVELVEKLLQASKVRFYGANQ